MFRALQGHRQGDIYKGTTRTADSVKEVCIHSFIHCIALACAECDDSLPFAGASSIPLCYIPFPSTLFQQLVFQLPSFHLTIYFLV